MGPVVTVLQYPSRNPYDWTKADLRDRVFWSLDGRTPVVAGDGKYVTGSLFAIAWLDWVDAIAVRMFGVHIHVIQPPFNTGVVLSAGTHDKDGAFDVSIPGVGWWKAQRFLRAHFGWFWFRHTGPWASRSSWHLHGGPNGILKYGLAVGVFIPGQVQDYLNRAFGLEGQHTPGSDGSWFPADRAAVWPFRSYIQEMIDSMPLSDADIQKVAKATADELLSREVGPDTDRTPVRTALYRASNVPDIIRAKVDKIVAKIGA